MRGLAGTVLVVEDDHDIAALLTLLLRRGGYTVDVRHDGRRALAAVVDERPDLVLLDLGLPDLTGWQVLRLLRASSDVPVLLVTGQADAVDRERAAALGAGLLPKPFRSGDLLSRVEAAMTGDAGAPHRVG